MNSIAVDFQFIRKPAFGNKTGPAAETVADNLTAYLLGELGAQRDHGVALQSDFRPEFLTRHYNPFHIWYSILYRIS